MKTPVNKAWHLETDAIVEYHDFPGITIWHTSCRIPKVRKGLVIEDVSACERCDKQTSCCSFLRCEDCGKKPSKTTLTKAKLLGWTPIFEKEK